MIIKSFAHQMALFIVALLYLACGVYSDPQNEYLVQSLPGQPPVNFKQYAGQFVINKQHGRALFYWFYEADHPNSSSLPLTLWLNGGPGCSSVGNGALDELGPFRVNKNGTGLIMNKYAWTKVSNIIFLESPAGVGYGYSNTNLPFNDSITAKDNLEFLIMWFDKFPEYRQNDFHIAGESYAGHYIPTLAKEILSHNKRTGYSHRKYINFKGFAIGNACTDSKYDRRARFDFLYTVSMITQETHDIAIRCGLRQNKTEDNCTLAHINFNKEIRNINLYDILQDDVNECVPLANVTQKVHFDLAGVYNTCRDHIEVYLNKKTVQHALHVNHPVYWSSCNDEINTKYSRSDSMLPLYKELLKSGLKIWIFSGDMDAICPTLGSRTWLKKLKLPVETPWRPWNSHGSVGGWIEQYKGLTFATVRGAGHMVPKTKPERALQLFKCFLAGEPLPSF